MNSIVPNMAMLIAGGGPNDTRRRPQNWTSLMLDNIVMDDRERPVDQRAVDQLAESIRSQGMLQAIGVKQGKSGEPYQLLYGAHRYLAMQQVRQDEPDKDTIACVIFPNDMPEWQCRMAEVAENLIRKELTTKERDAHMALYVGLLKKSGTVVEGRKAQATAQAESKGGARPEVLGSSLLTATQQTARDFGISDDTVRNRVRNATKLAKRNGVEVTNKATPEAMSGDELIKVGEAAKKAAEVDRAEATKRGKAARHVNPMQPSNDTQCTVRLNTVDPTDFIAWLRNRIKGKHKPMQLHTLKAYADALNALIQELDAETGS